MPSSKKPAAKAVAGQVRDALRLFDSYFVREPEHHLAVQRLADPGAMHIWRALSKKKFRRSGGGFDLPNLAMHIARAAGLVLLGDENRKSKPDIIAAANEASSLSTRLADLIRNNAILQFPHMGANLRPPASALTVATARIIRGLSNSRILQLEASESGSHKRRGQVAWFELKFTPDVEVHLNDLQEFEFPEFSMTTAEAYKLLELISIGMDMRLLEGQLRAFAKLAKKSEACDPITKRPQSKLARERSFAVSLCRLFEYHFATPCITIAADSTAVVFDLTNGLNGETAKKWWLRQGDK